MELNLPEVVGEVSEMFAKYERALMANDVDALNEYFWNDPRVLRYGVLENLYGWAAIAKYRSERPPAVQRKLHRTIITTFGRNTATAVTEYQEHRASQIGRQSQTWVRIENEWRIVSAHVSLPPIPGTTEQI
ncbi:oxalurate catabolism protein HpxZ [soil metagenome]